MKANNKIGKTITSAAVGIVMMVSSAFAANQGPFGGSSFTNYVLAGSSTSWTNLGNVSSYDNVEANTSSLLSANSSYSDYLLINDFKFTMSSTEQVAGIFVEVSRRTSNSSKTKDHSIMLFANGSSVGSDYATSASWSASNAYNSYGGETDLWGTTFTNAQVTNSNFGVGISVEKTGGPGSITAYIDFVKITLYTTPVSLPVEMGNMQLLRKQTSVCFIWNTLSEVNCDHFEIQRSTDGVNFSSVGDVKGNGSSSQINFYEFEDEHPILGTSYYRLKQIDFDGQYCIYTSVAVNFESRNPMSINVYPNPVADHLNISVEGFDEMTNLKITDVKGTVIYTSVLSLLSSNLQMNVDDLGLEAGIYYVTVSSIDSSKLVQKPIIIQ